MRSGFLATLLCVACAAYADPVRVHDDSGREVVLAAPARRILSLAPNITELLFAAGAGGQIVGAVEFSDYPEAATRIARVGSLYALDIERVLELRPDLAVIWLRGGARRQIERVLALGIPVFYSEPRRLEDVARALEQFGTLAGTEVSARRAAREYRERLAALRSRYAHRTDISVFYQVWDRPLLTVNGDHLISDAIRLCGGRNVFGTLPNLVPAVSLEAVLEANPDALISSANDAAGAARARAMSMWERWPRLAAQAHGNLFVVDSDSISRHGPRILDGVQAVCGALETARARR